jgi:hypothetical protein
MPAVAIVSLVLVGLLVVALAAYLVWVVLILRRIGDTLGKVTFGVRAIAHRTAPLGELVDAVNAELAPVADAVEALAARVDGQREGRRTGAQPEPMAP